jgi:hypothetical protein
MTVIFLGHRRFIEERQNYGTMYMTPRLAACNTVHGSVLLFLPDLLNTVGSFVVKGEGLWRPYRNNRQYPLPYLAS